MLDDASQFTTKTINDPGYHDIYDNIFDEPSDEDPPESISEGGKDAVQNGVTVVENPVSNTISKNSLPCSEMELLGDKSKALLTGGKGVRTDERGPKPCPLYLTGRQQLTNRQKYILAAQCVTVSGRQRLTNRHKYICWPHDM